MCFKMRETSPGFCCGFPFPDTGCSGPGRVCTGCTLLNSYHGYSLSFGSILTCQFHFFGSILTCQFHAQAFCYVDLPATSVEPLHFPPFGEPSSPEEASSAVGSLGSLLCHVNFGQVDVLTIYFFHQKQVNRVFHFVNACRFSHPDVKRSGAHLFLTFCIADTRN